MGHGLYARHCKEGGNVMGMKSIQDLDLKSKRVLIRVDFNVPLDENCNITDDGRIKSALSTIQHAINKGAKVILMSHLGRPKGKVDKKKSLIPVARRLSEAPPVITFLAVDGAAMELAST